MSESNNNEKLKNMPVKDRSAAGPSSQPIGLKFALLMTSVFLGSFLITLDKLIISTAIPQITNDFNSASDVGWYGTAYLLTGCAFQLVFGKLYTLFSIRFTFLASILLFEIGSAICGAAPTSLAFIIGRAIAGLGAGGIQSGAIAVIVYNVPLNRRPIYQGLFGAVLGISSVLGPLVGGAFTTNVTWRWCFYINLPLGAVVMVLVYFLLQDPDRPATKVALKEKLPQLNFLGLLALFPGVICLCLGLQWGGTKYAWNDGRIIALFVLAAILLIAFILIQVWKPAQATVPPRIFMQRSILAGFWVSACTGGYLNIFVYFLPTWFQAIQGVDAEESGIHLLPMVLALVVATIITGKSVSAIGYYTPFLIFGTALVSIGSGLLYTLTPSTTTAQWIGFLILLGFGCGSSSQAPNMAAQTVLSKSDASIGGSLMFFGQQLFGSILIAVGQNTLDTQLATRLSRIPGLDFGGDKDVAALIQTSGLTELLGRVPVDMHAAAVLAYNDSLRQCFCIGLILACLAILGAIAMEWRSVKKGMPGKQKAADAEQGTIGANSNVPSESSESIKVES